MRTPSIHWSLFAAVGAMGACGFTQPGKHASSSGASPQRPAAVAPQVPGDLTLNHNGRKPNIIYILADDMGIGDVGCYSDFKTAPNGPAIETLNIDALCREGVRFTNFYSGAAVCAPTRSTLLTGLHTGHTTVRGNGHINPQVPQEQLSLKPTDVTVGEVMKKAGYVTATVGKWGVALPGTPGVPWLKGFDAFYGFLDQVEAHNHYPPFVNRNAERVPLAGNEGNDLLNPSAPGKKYGTFINDEFTREALGFVEANKDKPFFLQLWYTAPHAGLELPNDSRAPYVNRWGPEKPWASNGHYPAQEYPHAAYAGLITRMDRDIGTLMQRIRALNLEENTLVVFTSDNGPSVAGGIDYQFFNSSGKFRGYKGALYEGGIRAPLVARWPGRIPPGRSSEVLGASWDLFATAADVGGAAAPASTDGISLRAAMMGEAPSAKHDFLYWESPEADGLVRALRHENWKLYRAKDGSLELYDLAADPGESRNLASERRDMVDLLKQKMHGARTAGELYPLGALDLEAVQCNQNRTATGRLVTEAPGREIACLEDDRSPTGFSWHVTEPGRILGIQCNATGQAAWRIVNELTCAPEATSPTGWRWKLSSSVQPPAAQQAPAPAPAPAIQATPNPNDAATWIGWQCNANNTAAGRLAEVAGKSIVCLENAGSATGFAWAWLNADYPLGVQCNTNGTAAYRVGVAGLVCKPFASSPTGWRWQF